MQPAGWLPRCRLSPRYAIQWTAGSHSLLIAGFKGTTAGESYDVEVRLSNAALNKIRRNRTYFQDSRRFPTLCAYLTQ